MTQQRRASGVRESGSSGSRAAGVRAGRASGSRVGSSAIGGRKQSISRTNADRVSGARAANARFERTDRGTARPAGRRSGSGQAGSGHTALRMAAPQSGGFTTRAAVLGMVLLGLLLAYAYPVRVYLAQQAEIAAMEAEQTVQREKIDDLAEQRDLWNDPEYVKSQARRRLHYLLPGETPYVVIGGTSETTEETGDNASTDDEGSSTPVV